MKVVSFIASLLGLSIAGASCAWAFGGCADSPENPSIVLGMLGGAVAAWPWLRRTIPARLRNISRFKALGDQATTFNEEGGT
jgi:hypothetical protein